MTNLADELHDVSTECMVMAIRQAYRTGTLTIQHGSQDAIIEIMNIRASPDEMPDIASLSQTALALLRPIYSCVKC
ncbi:hypothetical protein GTP46_08275 [Duganella sp. FT135W]|uniref:Uncharacterized protein n=1 Tax=Duganella flavida TaxID=2692175 RepID=A0A6L8K5X3_9BURK|nr:hypothetical protein [Duganella flavida]MYM22640.1 hypothetical protein [Duganella flavida]